jgi:hypothetical protein
VPRPVSFLCSNTKAFSIFAPDVKSKRKQRPASSSCTGQSNMQETRIQKGSRRPCIRGRYTIPFPKQVSGWFLKTLHIHLPQVLNEAQAEIRIIELYGTGEDRFAEEERFWYRMRGDAFPPLPSEAFHTGPALQTPDRHPVRVSGQIDHVNTFSMAHIIGLHKEGANAL